MNHDEMDKVAIDLHAVVELVLTGASECERTPGGYYVNRIERTLKRGGWETCGNGHFALVVKHEKYPGVVFKIGTKKSDSGAAYAAWVRSQSGSGLLHLPNYMYMRRFKEAYILVMPEYKHISSVANKTMWEHRDALYAAESVLVGWRDAAQGNTLETTLQAIHTFFDGLVSFDLHIGNAMLDGEVIIITDPVSFTLSPAVLATRFDGDNLVTELTEQEEEL